MSLLRRLRGSPLWPMLWKELVQLRLRHWWHEVDLQVQ